uniref:Uncharacterized protein n=1 Tax=Candidatus Kentrum sp. LPFa TaxID=2126335 RepID=A0A450WWL9_9GAMM|nr:MAG: hypothetical protein BECKLPF1236A_GA0070988_103022 [Candidatus Kentron sp. LPFa]VFK34768.1 MAG: hypothetical protein BECKLPF1236C_GA0070990_102971 [Candidatus Kentron sp. LPFa]
MALLHLILVSYLENLRQNDQEILITNHAAKSGLIKYLRKNKSDSEHTSSKFGQIICLFPAPRAPREVVSPGQLGFWKTELMLARLRLRLMNHILH